jgi:hypothetical protein
MIPTKDKTRPEIRGLDEASRLGRQRARPPVDQWNPAFSGNLDIRVAADGTWSYLGSPIRRQRLVGLFASILRHDDDGRYYLVTPVEKVGITVEDAPFLAVSMVVEGRGRGQQVTFSTNVGDEVTAGPDHKLRFETADAGGLKPYLRVRGRLEALVTRALVYDLVELADERDLAGERVFGIWSGGAFFAIAPADQIERQ